MPMFMVIKDTININIDAFFLFLIYKDNKKELLMWKTRRQKPRTSSFRNFIDWLFNLFWSYKYVFLPIITITSGSTLVGFASEFATYSYALSIGMRPPVEGVPYLQTIIFALTISISILVGLFFVISFSYIKLLKLRLNDYHVIFVFLPSFLLLLYIMLYSYFLIQNVYHNGIAIGFNYFDFLALYLFLSSTLVTFFVVKFNLKTGNASRYIATSFYLLLAISIFFPSNYQYIISKTGFGGGIYIYITTKDKLDREIVCKLEIRTTEYFMCSNQNNSIYNEIPLNSVQSYRYANDFDHSIYLQMQFEKTDRSQYPNLLREKVLETQISQNRLAALWKNNRAIEGMLRRNPSQMFKDFTILPFKVDLFSLVQELNNLSLFIDKTSEKISILFENLDFETNQPIQKYQSDFQLNKLNDAELKQKELIDLVVLKLSKEYTEETITDEKAREIIKLINLVLKRPRFNEIYQVSRTASGVYKLNSKEIEGVIGSLFESLSE